MSLVSGYAEGRKENKKRFFLRFMVRPGGAQTLLLTSVGQAKPGEPLGRDLGASAPFSAAKQQAEGREVHELPPSRPPTPSHPSLAVPLHLQSRVPVFRNGAWCHSFPVLITQLIAVTPDKHTHL